MKHIYKGLAFCAALAFAHTQLPLKRRWPTWWKRPKADTLQKVQVAFRSIDRNDLLGGVSVIDMKEMSEKVYTTYSLSLVDKCRWWFQR